MIVVVPMAGSLVFESKDFSYPKPLIELDDKTLIEHTIGAFESVQEVEFRFVLKKDDDRKFHLSSVIRQAARDRPLQCVITPGDTAGALCSVLMALPCSTDCDDEVIVTNYDQIINLDLNWVIKRFRDQKLDFGLLTFDSVHPKWSYVRIDTDSLVCQASEKVPISRNALCGFYYFRSGMDLVNAIENILEAASPSRDNFFVSEVINEFVLMGKKGKAHAIDRNQYIKFYDSNIVEEYVATHKSDANHLMNLTRLFVDAFNTKDLTRVLELFDENASWCDSSVYLDGREEISDFLASFFDSSYDINLVSKSIRVKENISIIYLDLLVDKKCYRGTNFIQWDNEKVQEFHVCSFEVPDVGT